MPPNFGHPITASSVGTICPFSNGVADGASFCQPWGSLGGICAPPFHGPSVEAFRPAWASWIAIGMSDQRRMLFSVRPIAASVASS